MNELGGRREQAETSTLTTQQQMCSRRCFDAVCKIRSRMNVYSIITIQEYRATRMSTPPRSPASLRFRLNILAAGDTPD